MEFLLLLCFSAVAIARPDIGLGYNYQPPATSYGVPSGSIGGLNSDRQYYHVQKNSFFGTGAPNAPSTDFQAPIHGASRFAGSGGLTSTADSTLISASNQGFSTGGFTNGVSSEKVTTGGSNIDLRSGALNSFSSGFTNQEAEVQKHLYFFAAPEEPEEVQSRINIPVAPPKKNVKILIIKAPTYRAPAPVQIPLQPQIEEKTRVYVLVKKPEEQEPIVYPSAAPTAPVKPEVYFIKYRTQQEAADAINNVQSGSDENAISANSFEGEQDLISTLDKDSSSNNAIITGVRSGFGSSNSGSSANFGRLSSTSTLSSGLSASDSTGSSGTDSASNSQNSDTSGFSNLGSSANFGGLSSTSTLSGGLSASDSTGSSGTDSTSNSQDSDTSGFSNLGSSTNFGGSSTGSLSAGLSVTGSTGSSESGSTSDSHESSGLSSTKSTSDVAVSGFDASVTNTGFGQSGSIGFGASLSSGSQDKGFSGTKSTGSLSGFEGSITGGTQGAGFAGFESTASTVGSGSVDFGLRGGFSTGGSSSGATGGPHDIYGPPKLH